MMTAGGPGSGPVQLTTVPSACLSDPAATVCEYEAGSYPANLVDSVLDTHRQEMAVLLKYVKPTMLKVATDGGLYWHVSDVSQYSRLLSYHLTVCVPVQGGAGPGQCDGAARGRGSLPLLGLQPAAAARLGEDGRGRGGARVARGGAGQLSSLEAISHVLHVDCPPVTGCCSPRPGSWASWCGWRSASTGGTTASTSPPATDPPASKTTHPGQSAQPVYYIYTPCLLSILYLHTVSTIYTISTHGVYVSYLHIYSPAPCWPSPWTPTTCPPSSQSTCQHPAPALSTILCFIDYICISDQVFTSYDDSVSVYCRV